MKDNIRKYLSLILITILGAFLILYNINDTLLWKDEAGTAQIGINTIKYGIPKVWDGKNMMASADGNSFNDDFIVTSHGWLQYYFAGISIAILGENTLAARLPFALISIASIILTWFLAKTIFKKDSLSNLTALIYVFYIPFTLYSRQARYYSPTFFFLLLASLLFMDLVIKHNINFSISKNILLAVSVMLLAFSNHLSAAVWCLSALVYIILFKKLQLLKTLIPIFFGGLLWLPWYIYTIVTFPASYGNLTVNSHIFTKILLAFWKTNTYFIPIISMLILIMIFNVIYFIKNIKTEKNKEDHKISPYWFFILIIIFNIVLISIPTWSLTNHYLLCVVIAVPIILTYFYNYIKRISLYIGIILLLMILCSNTLNIFPYYCYSTTFIPETNNAVNNYLSANSQYTTNYGILASPATDWNAYAMPLKQYMNTLQSVFYPKLYASELFGHIEAPNEMIIKTLKDHAVDGETVLVLGIEYEPIVYYTNLKVVNTLSEKVKPWQDQFSSYPNLEKYSYLTYVADEKIDWFIVKKDGAGLNMLLDNPNFLNENMGKFDIYECKTADIPLSNSPDLDYHIFSTIPEKDSFYMLHKKK